jgi:hypothetical protein
MNLNTQILGAAAERPASVRLVASAKCWIESEGWKVRQVNAGQ